MDVVMAMQRLWKRNGNGNEWLGDGWRDGNGDGWLGDGRLGNGRLGDGWHKGLAMDGSTAMQRRWTAHRQCNGDRVTQRQWTA
jgi:hypothetical protein